MKIGFWSPMPGIGRATSNLLACALYSTVNNRYECGVLQTQYKYNNLKHSIIKDERVSSMSGPVYSTGIDVLMKFVDSNNAGRESVITSSQSFIQKRFNLYSPTGIVDKALYEKTFMGCCSKLLDSLDAVYDLVFVDVRPGMYKNSIEVLMECDVIVVCLGDTKYYVEQFFEYNFEPFENSNVFYMRGDYDPDVAFNMNNMIRNFPQIKAKNSGYILHNSNYANAINGSGVIKFFNSNLDSLKKDTNSEFVKSVSNTTEKLLKFCGISTGGRAWL